jgi:membrane-associated progesterone receptor component
MSPVREINLVDIGLVSILIYLIIALIRPALRPRSPTQPTKEGYQALPGKHPQCLVYKKFTPRELAKYDGKRADGGGRLLLAIQRRMKAKDETAERGWREVRLERTVFDVTTGASFYGPGESVKA